MHLSGGEGERGNRWRTQGNPDVSLWAADIAGRGRRAGVTETEIKEPEITKKALVDHLLQKDADLFHFCIFFLDD